MRVWYVNCLPEEKNAFGFCYQRNIFGVDWDIKQVAETLDTDSVLREGLTKEFLLRKSTTASLLMKKKDFVWTQNSKLHGGDGRFYLGQITGPWEDRSPVAKYWVSFDPETVHEEKEEYQRAGIISALPCEFRHVRISDVAQNRRGFFISLAKILQGRIVRSIDDEQFLQNTKTIWQEIRR